MNKSKLKYSDSRDHSLGIVGMAIALFAFDCSEYLISVSLKEGEQDFVISDDFVNFSLSFSNPSEAYQNQVDHFKVYCGMIFSNYFCRRYCAHHTPNIDDVKLIETHLCTIAAAQMSIAEDDACKIAHDVQHSFHILYTQDMLVKIARDLADELNTNVEMNHDEVNNYLSAFFEE